MIKNISLITDKIKDFSIKNIEFMVGFALNFQNRSFDVNCLLDIDFIIKDKEKQYIACFRFHNPTNIHFESGGIYHQMSIEMYDIRDRGWENKTYEVIDYEEDTLHFYCTDIEILSLRETQSII
ncbi:hypothetical protein [Neobacillus niacini]|uniref:hypothetical protein n=1 Tax=Neobacillus niacini TaxID=86668 RepID=UPI0028667B5A|nr:hypothetical protein [Neobacillus niacini]MDR7002746.1 hypothetical protein [Neobacillus niacini]